MHDSYDSNSFEDSCDPIVIGYTADLARFDHLTLAEQKSVVFGGTPERWANPPKLSAHPTPGASVILAEAAEVLARIQDLIRNPD